MLKRWLPASMIAAAMALALAGGAVLAFGGSGNSHQEDVFERAAAILGIETSDLQSAHDQAQREIQDEQLAKAVDALLAQEIIDQDEADSFTAWISTRPESADETLFRQLTSTLHGSPLIGTSRIEIQKLPHLQSEGLTDRMAEILGLDSQELTEALDGGKAELASLDRLDKIHATIDSMLADGAIDATQAEELHSWVDDIPQWLLDLDIPTRLFGSHGLFENHFGGSGFMKRLPFGRGDHFSEGDREFRFEFRSPEGTFRFGPDAESFPFEGEGFEGLLERFGVDPLEHLHELENLEDLEGLLEGFRGHNFFGPRFEELIPPTVEPESSTTSA